MTAHLNDLRYLYFGGGTDAEYAALKAYADAGIDVLAVLDAVQNGGVGGGATTLNGLSDVTITTPAANNVVSYNGTQWVNRTLAAAGIEAAGAAASAQSAAEAYTDTQVSSEASTRSSADSALDTRVTALESSPSLPAGGTTHQVLAKTSNADGDATWYDSLQLTTLGVGGALSANAKLAELFDSSTISVDSNAIASVRLNDTRTFSVAQSASGLGDGQAAFRINANPTYNATGDYYAIAIGGGVAGSAVLRSTTAVGSHFGLLGAGSTMHRYFAAHIGIDNGAGLVVPDGVGYDVDAINALGTSKFTRASGFRMRDGISLTGDTIYGFAIGDYSSVHRGKVMIGASDIQQTPQARLHVQERNKASGLPSELIETLNDRSGLTARKFFQNGIATTGSGSTTAVGFTQPDNTIYVIEVTILARCTGGTSGTVGDGMSTRVIATFRKGTGVDQTQLGANFVPWTHKSASASAWSATVAAGFGAIAVNVTGAANVNIDWDVHATIYQVA